MPGSQDGSSPDDEARIEEEVYITAQRAIAAALEEDRQARQRVEQEHQHRMDGIHISMDELHDCMDQATSAGRSQDQHLSNIWDKTKQRTAPTASPTPSRGRIAGLRVSTQHGAGTPLPGTLRVSQKCRVGPWTGVLESGEDLQTKLMVFKSTQLATFAQRGVTEAVTS